MSNWIPSLDGVQEKLQRGAKVADIGCGHGASTIVMAKAFPLSMFHAFDYHAPSIDRARRLAKEAGVADRITFDVFRLTCEYIVFLAVTSCCTTRPLTTRGHTVQGGMPDNGKIYLP